MSSTVEGVWDRLDKLLSWIAALAVLAPMLLITVDVVARYVFNAPIFWVYDFVSYYVLNVIVYLALSETLRSSRHVSLSLFVDTMPRRATYVARLLAWLLVALFFVLFTGILAYATAQSWLISEVVPGRVAWPIWLQKGLITFGIAMLTQRILFGLVRAAITGEFPNSEEKLG